MYRVGQTIGNITLLYYRTIRTKRNKSVSGGKNAPRKNYLYRKLWLCSDGNITEWRRLDSKHIGSRLKTRRQTPLTKRERRQLEAFKKNGFKYHIFQWFTCRDCKTVFEALENPTHDAGNRLCPNCRKKAARDTNLRCRCRKFKVSYTRNLTKTYILERDRWICQICGELAPKELKGTIDPLAPEVDHIIPLSWGPKLSPGHIESNCQCTHRKCNGEKSNHNSFIINNPKGNLK